jgi:type IX secretion system PorP/SprF family membrane protein
MRKLLLGVLASLALSVQAQDVHFTQYYTSPLTLNPANTGLTKCDYRAAANYRTQWGVVNGKPYTTATVSADMGILKNKLGGDVLGVGILGLYDRSGTGALSNVTLGLSTAYHHSFGDPSDKPNVLSLGVQGYLVQKSIDFSALNFEDEYDPITGTPIKATKENLNNRDLSYADFNAGAMWTGYANTRSTYFLGASYYHMARPEESFLLVNDQPKINSRISLSAGGNIQMNDNFMLMTSAMLQKQGPASEFLLGAASGFILNPTHDEFTNNTVLYLGAWYRLQDAIAPYFGMEWGKNRFGLSYDVNVSSFQPATKGQGALELSYVFNGCINKTETRKYNFACPRF